MKNIITFDMDGVLADLYAVDNWLEKLRKEDVSPYVEAKPICDMQKLNNICALLRKIGYEIQVVTCFSLGASKEYKTKIRKAKKEWLAQYGFQYDHFHGIDYKYPKKEAIRKDMREGGIAWLIDDEARHRKNWPYGPTIDPTVVDLIETLMALLPKDI